VRVSDSLLYYRGDQRINNPPPVKGTKKTGGILWCMCQRVSNPPPRGGGRYTGTPILSDPKGGSIYRYPHPLTEGGVDIPVPPSSYRRGGRYTGTPILLIFWAFQLTNVTFWNMHEVLKIYSFCMRGDTI